MPPREGASFKDVFLASSFGEIIVVRPPSIKEIRTLAHRAIVMAELMFRVYCASVAAFLEGKPKQS